MVVIVPSPFMYVSNVCPQLALDHIGPSCSQWYKELSGPRRGPIMWTFSYDF